MRGNRKNALLFQYSIFTRYFIKHDQENLLQWIQPATSILDFRLWAQVSPFILWFLHWRPLLSLPVSFFSFGLSPCTSRRLYFKLFSRTRARQLSTIPWRFCICQIYHLVAIPVTHTLIEQRQVRSPSLWPFVRTHPIGVWMTFPLPYRQVVPTSYRILASKRARWLAITPSAIQALLLQQDRFLGQTPTQAVTVTMTEVLQTLITFPKPWLRFPTPSAQWVSSFEIWVDLRIPLRSSSVAKTHMLFLSKTRFPMAFVSAQSSYAVRLKALVFCLICFLSCDETILTRNFKTETVHLFFYDTYYTFFVPQQIRETETNRFGSVRTR